MQDFENNFDVLYINAIVSISGSVSKLIYKLRRVFQLNSWFLLFTPHFLTKDFQYLPV